MVIKLSDYILEQSISDASVDDIELERLFAEMNVKLSLIDALLKDSSLIQEGLIGNAAAANFRKLGEKWSGINSTKQLTGSTTQLLQMILDVIVALGKTCVQSIQIIDQIFNQEEYAHYHQFMEEVKEKIKTTDDKALKGQLKKELRTETISHVVSSTKTSIDFLKKFVNFINPLQKTTTASEEAVQQYYGMIQNGANQLAQYSTPTFTSTSYYGGTDGLSQIDYEITTLQKMINSEEYKNLKGFIQKTDITTLKSELNNALSKFDVTQLAKINMSLKKASTNAQNMIRNFSAYAKANKIETTNNIKVLSKYMNTKQISNNYTDSNMKNGNKIS